MLKYKNVPQNTPFVFVSETHNPQEPFIATRGGLYQLMGILTESNCITWMPVPPDVMKEFEEANPSVICLALPIQGPVGQKKPEERFFQGTDNYVSMRRTLRVLVAGIPKQGEYMR